MDFYDLAFSSTIVLPKPSILKRGELEPTRVIGGTLIAFLFLIYWGYNNSKDNYTLNHTVHIKALVFTSRQDRAVHYLGLIDLNDSHGIFLQMLYGNRPRMRVINVMYYGKLYACVVNLMDQSVLIGGQGDNAIWAIRTWEHSTDNLNNVYYSVVHFPFPNRGTWNTLIVYCNFEIIQGPLNIPVLPNSILRMNGGEVYLVEDTVGLTHTRPL